MSLPDGHSPSSMLKQLIPLGERREQPICSVSELESSGSVGRAQSLILEQRRLGFTVSVS